jgi:hypothetical protein
MMLANGLGVAVGVIILEHTKELRALRDTVHGGAGHKT